MLGNSNRLTHFRNAPNIPTVNSCLVKKFQQRRKQFSYFKTYWVFVCAYELLWLWRLLLLLLQDDWWLGIHSLTMSAFKTSPLFHIKPKIVCATRFVFNIFQFYHQKSIIYAQTHINLYLNRNSDCRLQLKISSLVTNATFFKVSESKWFIFIYSSMQWTYCDDQSLSVISGCF